MEFSPSEDGHTSDTTRCKRPKITENETIFILPLLSLTMLQVISDEDEVDWDIARRVPHSRRSTWKRYRYSQTAFGGCYIGQARRRVGRGGRWVENGRGLEGVAY